ncbi:hypothetical protein [Amantichitinum ursilacus]|uniref:DNA methylase n=1 Tax=Amantichitinum ursilacus TaxID=857265 RepID=A0A0N0GL73_9NEIS|nr:hypothetical protein [Amantichitinum ursilacus]KPC49676.1 hypothetical protein WG78_20175 [Amantichitinum ursilacus]
MTQHSATHTDSHSSATPARSPAHHSVRQRSASDLGINMVGERGLFRWLLASWFFGKPVQAEVAERTWHVFMEKRMTSPHAILQRSWQQLVDALGEGHYRRLDESSARNLHTMCQQLTDQYGGSIRKMYSRSRSRQEFEEKLAELQGVGPKTIEIFMREAGPYLFPKHPGE